VRTNVQGGAEQRKHRRYNLSFPVRVKPKSKDIAAPPIETSTKDISARGIYLVLSEELELGSELELEITLPAELAGGKSVKLRCRGKVARLEPKNAEGKVGVGAVIQDYEFFHEPKPEDVRASTN
jgi:c-di-GMP-binding flagellar brake protein YcgR